MIEIEQMTGSLLEIMRFVGITAYDVLGKPSPCGCKDWELVDHDVPTLFVCKCGTILRRTEASKDYLFGVIYEYTYYRDLNEYMAVIL